MNLIFVIRELKYIFEISYMDLVLNYRRTTFGPLWLTIFMGIIVISITYIYSSLFNQNIIDFSSYVYTGIVAWVWIQSLISEAGNTFIINAYIIKNTNTKIELYIWVTCFKFLIIFFHNVIWIFPFYLLNIINFNFLNFILLILSILIIFFISIPITYITSLIFARYRDFQKFASSLSFLIMFLTPVFWKPSSISIDKSFVVEYNPIYWLIELIRNPLLCKPISLDIYVYTLFLLLFLWVLALLLHIKFNNKIIYWV
jgi:ABC-type polysaccharide/polyol phosphate export permease